MTAVDPVALAQALIRCPSVTPVDAGALDVLETALKELGFTCHRLPFGDGSERVDNLYARRGENVPNFCFAGHTDVVPAGDASSWSSDPFAGDIENDFLLGRGAVDMKGAVAAFVAAAGEFLEDHPSGPAGSISLLITGDEEGFAINGTRKVIDWLAENGEEISACVVGEPTNPEYLGEMVKVGRRGSMSGIITVTGTQGHVAYPHLADNPVPKMIRLLATIAEETLDDGTEHFQPSNLEITSIDVGNLADNVIPSEATARFNIRFNDQHTGKSLEEWLVARLTSADVPHRLETRVSGEAFLTPPGPLSELVSNAVEEITGHRPQLSTSGGTSDARFIKDVCPVVEFGLVGQTMHKVDERTPISQIHQLKNIYRAILDGFFDIS